MLHFSLFSVLDYYENGSRTLSTLYADLLDQIVEAEHLGFDAYWIGEHHGYLTAQHALVCPNPAIVLAAAAQRTQHIGLNTAIANLSLRHPLLLAEDYALDGWWVVSDVSDQSNPGQPINQYPPTRRRSCVTLARHPTHEHPIFGRRNGNETLYLISR